MNNKNIEGKYGSYTGSNDESLSDINPLRKKPSLKKKYGDDIKKRNRKIKLKPRKKDLKKDLTAKIFRQGTFQIYKWSGTPAVISWSFGLSLLWWPFHYVAKYGLGSRLFCKLVDLSKMESINMIEIDKEVETSHLPTLLVVGMAMLIILIQVSLLIILIIAIMQKFGFLLDLYIFFT